MTRINTASASALAHAAGTHQGHAASEAPANQTGHAPVREPLPVYVLTGTQRTRYMIAATALPASKVKRKLPAHVNVRLDWMGAIQGAAWYDRDELSLASFDGRPVTRDDIDDFGFRIAFAREVIAREAVPANTSSTQPSKLGDKALKFEVRRCQSVLCDAFVTRFKSDTETPAESLRARRRIVQSVRRARSVSARLAGSESLFALCDDEATVAWLRGLPKGEGAALDRLRELHPEWDRRMKHTGSTPAHDGTASDLAQRAYALAFEPLGRIVNAGRYLIKGRADRKGDYPGYRSPKSHTVKEALSVAQPAQPEVQPEVPPHGG